MTGEPGQWADFGGELWETEFREKEGQAGLGGEGKEDNLKWAEGNLQVENAGGISLVKAESG